MQSHLHTGAFLFCSGPSRVFAASMQPSSTWHSAVLAVNTSCRSSISVRTANKHRSIFTHGRVLNAPYILHLHDPAAFCAFGFAPPQAVRPTVISARTVLSDFWMCHKCAETGPCRRVQNSAMKLLIFSLLTLDCAAYLRSCDSNKSLIR
eukprot:COSAG02_NODE_88_length_38629_cov_457.967999_14_plen_150_part_00